jgi:hypothetical protein
MGILQKVFNGISREPAPVIVKVQPNEDGFVACWTDGRTETVSWSQVKKVFTYKVDCFTYDLIYLAFELGDRSDTLHLHEETEGFQDLSSHLCKALPDLNPEWYFNVMQPAFAENLTLLFERKPESRHQ